jgi:enamine deaminase RidA (YjgF/YER057c/UK114 family)
MGNRERRSVGSGVSWEETYGYSRAVRVGDRIYVSGTTATGPDGLVARGNPAGQARYALDKIEKAIRDLGGALGDVVRTRIFIARMEDWEQVARVHGERFGKIRPANTLVRADLVGEEYLVEIEAEAVVGSARPGNAGE